MRLKKPTKTEWFAVVVILAMLVALVPPTPHHRETRRESCHLCGNRRVTIRAFRWWRVSSKTTEPEVSFPAGDGHVHDWWRFGASYESYSKNWAASAHTRYRDGRHDWNPGT